ncbi:nucleotidyltransferase domain-containing protein [Alteribacter populi]|uniref:nucleotidyltransferase domain-containing protein n=1 Tax=Alteribacter populi TaxID=2011011 RepID=UPI000BBB3D55|nr:nucleotidyltransferase domain-containing protein [Alteribacter populi]
MYGLLDRDLHYILEALKKFDEIESVILFGSRAMGNYKKGSDVDIALKGGKISSEVMSELDEMLNEVNPLPYFFDIIHYEAVNNDNLIEHIDKVGKELYRKE